MSAVAATDGLAILLAEADTLRERLSAPVFTLGEANRLREEGVCLDEEWRRRKAPARADALTHNEEVAALAEGIAEDLATAQEWERKCARIFGKRSPEAKRAARVADGAWEALNRMRDAHVSI